MQSPSRSTVGPGERLLAFGSLACGLALVVVLVVFVVRNLGFVVLALLGVALLALGAWWTLTERMPRRAVGIAVAVAGLVITIVSLVHTAPDDKPLVHLLVFAVLVVGTIGFGRAALRHHLHAADARQPLRISPPRQAVLICNPWSGGGKVEQFGLVKAAEDLGVKVVLLDHGLDLEQLARDAVAGGADCLGMAGGDGSQALVASIAVEHDLPFVCVSAGTRNHFALDLGIDRDDPRNSLHAFRDGIERRVDYATVGDRLFVNNVSLGVYATIVQEPGYREDKAGTTSSLLPEILGRTEEPFDLQFDEPDGSKVDGAFLIMVSNNPYAFGAGLASNQRRRVDGGRLGVMGVTASTGKEAASVVTLLAVGQRHKSPGWHEFTAERFEVRTRSGRVNAGIDGEALNLDAPLEFAIHPRGLRLLVPEGNLSAAEQRRARDVTVSDLVSLVRGSDPLT